MRVQSKLLLTLPFVLIVTATAVSRSGGVIPGRQGIPIDAARTLPSCGSCHRAMPGGSDPGVPQVAVGVVPGNRALDLGETIGFTVSVSGGPATTAPEGGFAAELEAGSWTPRGNTRIDQRGPAFITHDDSTTRTWSFDYTAPSQPGPTRWWFVCNSVDGDGSNNGDYWAFHGFDPTAQQSTPVHGYVNAVGVQRGTAAHDGCVGPYGNWPVLGGREVPTSPNPSFGFELVGAPASAAASLFIGFPTAVPLDVIGVNGCVLGVQPLATLGPILTSGSAGSQLGDGTAVFPLPLPAGMGSGTSFTVQAAMIHADSVAGRALSITLTNSLRFTVP